MDICVYLFMVRLRLCHERIIKNEIMFKYGHAPLYLHAPPALHSLLGHRRVNIFIVAMSVPINVPHNTRIK